MTPFLQLIRWKNLLIIIAAQCIVKFGFIGFDTALTTGQFSALVLATVCLASAGYIINDVYDVETDAVNKPDKQIVGKFINEALATNLFVIFTIIGVACGFYVANSVGKNVFATFFVLISILLYVYATYLKGTILIGNIVVSLLVGLTILIVGVFEFIPMLTIETRSTIQLMLKIILHFSILAFLINLIREMVKDLQDIDGDHRAELNTLPIAIGRDRAAKLTFVICLITIALVIYYIMTYMVNKDIGILYMLLLIIGPLLFVGIKVLSAKNKKDYSILSNVLKVVMLLGIGAMLLF